MFRNFRNKWQILKYLFLGTGKSTLLKILNNQLSFKGEIKIKNDIKIGYMPQITDNWNDI